MRNLKRYVILNRRAERGMSERGWSARVVVRYAVLQAPAVLLLVLVLTLVGRCVDIPAWFFWGLVGLWVVKDLSLFPFVWHAYDTDCAGAANCMVGVRGIAEDRLAPSGYIRVRGELWRAELMGDGPPIDKGQRVRVRGISGLKLIVQADDAGNDQPGS